MFVLQAVRRAVKECLLVTQLTISHHDVPNGHRLTTVPLVHYAFSPRCIIMHTQPTAIMSIIIG